MSSESISRTFIGSVVCVDLVGYSTKSTAQQSAIKQVFNGLLATALKGIPAEDRIILDTGDGAAISFLGDPESSLAVGLELRKVMCERAAELGATGEGPDQGPVRIGINLGPVKLAMDLNGYPKIIGDGINVAERIMSFAKPGQMVASRSFHDMVSRLSDENAALFRYEGVRTDKNVRDHEIYIVEPVPAKARSATLPPVPEAATAATTPGGFVGFLNDKFKVGFAAVLLAAVIAAEGLLLATRSPADPAKVASAPAPAPAPTAAPVETRPAPTVAMPPAPVPAAAAPAPKAEPAAAPRKVAGPEKPAAPAVAKAAPEPEKQAVPKASAPAATAKAPEPAKPVPIEPPKQAAAKPTPVEPPKPVPAKPVPIEPAKPAPPKAGSVEPPKSAARKPDEPARFAAPMPTAPVPSAPVPEPPREEPKPAAPAPTATVTLVSRAPVEFPVEAAARRIDAGIVKARVTINASGGVSNVQILEARPRRYFDGEATRALKLFKFNPGLEGRTFEVEIEFQR